ncbi:MAG: AMP-binding protein [Bryobacterales bacterium]|nr:AMP-binding protein [Bryobacterales bacterium]
METLLDLLPRIERLGSREALRFWNGYRTWRWSYADLDAGIRRFVAFLDRSGVASGDRLVLWSENRPEWVAIFWACLARGVQVVPLDHQSSADFVSRIVDQTGARLLVHGGAAKPVSGAECFAIESLNGLTIGPRFSPTPVSGSDVVQIMYTSGTTAEPKGVIHLHRNICANLEPIREEIDRYKKWAAPFQPIRILDLLPLSHMFGQSMGLFIPLLLEGSAVFMVGLHPGLVRQAVRKEGVSVLACVPRILESLRVDAERRHPRSKAIPAKPGGPLRKWWRHRDIHRAFGLKFWAFVVGGAMLDPETETFWSRVGLLVIQGYGLTETSPVVSVNHPFRARRGTLGEVVGSQEVRIADDGEILVRGSSVVGEYLEGGARRTRTVDKDGWFHTGDIGESDAQGRLVYRGRKKDLIVTADGMNIHPEDIERALKLEGGVRDAVVVPVGPASAQRIHAAIIFQVPGGDPLAIIENANRRLEPHQRIQSASEWPDEEFPHTASTFKTQRRKVAERLSSTVPTAGPNGGSGLEGILLALTGRSPDRLADDQRLAEDLGLSSLERIDMLAALEDQHGLELSETAFSTLSTVGQVREWVAGHAASPATSHIDGRAGSSATRPAATVHRIPPPRWARGRTVSMSRRALRQGLFLPLFHHYIALDVTGLPNLDGVAPPVIFAANHSSHLDTIALTAALPAEWRGKLAPAVRQQHFFPSGGWPSVRRTVGMRALYYLCCGLFNAYPLSQDLGQVRDSLRYTGELVEAGFCPLVYPEGILTPDGSLQRFQPGIGLMSQRLEVPVVPVHLHGLFDVMSVHDSWPRRGSVRVEIGAPLGPVKGEPYVRLAERVEASFRRMAERNRG